MDNGNAFLEGSVASSEERKRKKGTLSPVKKDSPRTTEQVLLGSFGAATTEDEIYGTPEVLETPPKRKILQLSSFKPNKDTLQKRPNDVVVLRLPDSEVLLSLLP